MRTHVTDDDDGKPVFDVNSEKIGIVVRVENGTAYVDPHTSLLDEYRIMLGWTDRNKDIYPLPADSIEEITDREIRLQTED